MGQINERLEKFERIAHSKIPVSEESFMYQLFRERRHICKTLNEELTESDREYHMKYLETLEDQIKSCLYL